jgi:Na+-transporting NADH:ubiquinone oxidoreductase subunit NqrB
MAFALLGTGVFVVWQSVLLPIGNVALPGPGFVPFLLGIVLGLVAVAIVIQAKWQERADQAGAISLGNRDTLVVFAALVGVGLFFEWLGTYVTLGLFTAALLLLVARTSPWRVVLGASLGMIAVWVFFRVLLGVQLPTGPF